MSMCHWRHVTCDIHLEGDLGKYIIAIIQSECMISTGGIKINVSGDIDLLGLPFLKVTLEPRHYLYNVACMQKAAELIVLQT